MKMAKNITLRNGDEALYPFTKASNLLNDDGTPFVPQKAIKAGKGIAIADDGTISAKATDGNSYLNIETAQEGGYFDIKSDNVAVIPGIDGIDQLTKSAGVIALAFKDDPDHLVTLRLDDLVVKTGTAFYVRAKVTSTGVTGTTATVTKANGANAFDFRFETTVFTFGN